MNQVSNQWMGKRYISLVRQSSDKDGPASTQAQIEFLDTQSSAVGMTYVDKVVGEGLTGSLPGRRSDLEALLQRKREKNDFDVISVQIEDRLTRGGGTHGMWFEHECNRHGISIFFAGDDVPKGPYSAMIRVAKYEAAHEVSVNIGKRSTQGQTYAQKTGFFRTAGHTPMGCDRLYLGEDHQPRYIIRNLPDGRQEQLKADTREVIGTFGTVGSKSRNRYKKQKNEYSLLIPGDPRQVRVVRIIFHLRFKKGWRGARIAGLLNRHGLPSPHGKTWSQRQVDCIYENEAYTGFTYNNQTYAGRFVRRDADRGFEPLNRDECAMATARHFQPQYLPFDSWKKIDQPHMHDFLPRDVRALAIEAHCKMWQHRLDPARPKLPKNRYPSSSYLLSKRLIAKQDGEALVGSLSGRAKKKVPYYRHKRAQRDRGSGSVFNNLIPAEPLHTAMLELLGEVLSDLPNLRSTLVQMLSETRMSVEAETESDSDLIAARDDVNARIAVMVSSLSGAALKDATAQLERLSNQRNAIEQQLVSRRSRQKETQEPIDVVVDRVLDQLMKLGESFRQLPTEPLYRLMEQLVPSATVDMATKDVEFAIALPEWAFTAKSKENDVCPAPSLRSRTSLWTHRILASAVCKYQHKRGSHHPVCYQCRRNAA